MHAHIVCTPRTTICEAPLAAHAPRHLPCSRQPCSNELLNVFQALPNSAEQRNQACCAPERVSTTGCMLPWMHPRQLTAATTTPLLPAAGGATRQRHPLVWPRKLRAHQIPPRVTHLQLLRARHAICLCRVTPCSRELLSVLQALPKSAEQCNEECFPPEYMSIAGRVHPRQLTAVSTIHVHAQCWRRHKQRRSNCKMQQTRPRATAL